MTITLYLIPPSPPCRSVLLLAKRIGVELTPVVVDLLKGEHLKPEFLAINPEHTVPTMVDHNTNLTLWESRAIMPYLVDKYAPGNPVYPQDPVERALVNRWLYFDIGFMQTVGKEIIRPLIFANQAPTEEKLQILDDKLKVWDAQLEKNGTKFVAGEEPTIADLALCVTLDMPVYLLSFDLSKYKNVNEWYLELKADLEGYDEICDSVLKGFKVMLDKRAAGDK